jgi:hypothetical protein
MTVVEFPKPKTAYNREARRLAASKPRRSKNGTPEERAAKIVLRKEKRRTWFRDFGHRLRVTRLALGITEVEAAAACLITLRTYRNREAGLPFRGWHEGLSLFVDKYDLTYDWLLCGEGDMHIDRATKGARRDQRRQSRPVLTVVCGEKRV